MPRTYREISIKIFQFYFNNSCTIILFFKFRRNNSYFSSKKEELLIYIKIKLFMFLKELFDMDKNFPENKLLENEQTILGLLYSVELNPKDTSTNEYLVGDKRIKLDIEGIFSISKRRIGEDQNLISSLLQSLLEKKQIKVEDGLYSLSDTGERIGKRIRAKWFGDFYDSILLRCAQSQAYAEFCRLAYGKNLFQFNVVDMQQLDLLIEKLHLNSKDTILDLGCGLGKITEYLANRIGAKITGIDFAEKSIQWARENTEGNGNLNYEVMDITELDFPPNYFDAIIALDVLYWIDDLEPVVAKLKEILKPDGRMGFFYVQFKNQDDNPESMLPENTRIAKLLKQYNFQYDVMDISQDAIEIWKTKIRVGKELRDQFLKENNQEIIDERITDGQDVIKKFETNQQKRYFFLVKQK